SRLRFQRPQLHRGPGTRISRIRAGFGRPCQFCGSGGAVADQPSTVSDVGAVLLFFLPDSSSCLRSCGKNTALARPWLETAGSAGVFVTQPPPEGSDSVFWGAVSILLSPVVMSIRSRVPRTMFLPRD